MSEPATPAPVHRAASRRELLVVAAAFVAVIVALVSLNTRVLLTKPFWLDEQCCTLYTILDSRSLFDVFRVVWDHDVAPPLLHVLLWVTGKLAGSLDPIVVRGFALASVAGALFLLYIVLRRHFSRSASTLGVLVVASNRIVIHHAFEGRFYGPWLLFAVAYVWALEMDAGSLRSRRRDLAIAVTSVLICAIHWFGITSLFLLAGGAAFAVSRTRGWRAGVRLVAPSLAGVALFLALTPLMLAQLRVGGQEILWVRPLNFGQLREFAGLYLLLWPMFVAVGLLLLDRVESRRVQPSRLVSDPALAALLATGLMTLVLAVISVLINPVMVHRYAIVSALLAAPVVALASEVFRPALRAVFAIAVALTSALIVGQAVRGAQFFSITFNTFAAVQKELESEKVPLVWPSLFLSYPVDGGARRDAPSRVLELPDSTIQALRVDTAISNKIRFDRNLARLHNSVFGYPILITQSQLDTTPRFYVFARRVDMPPSLPLSVLGRKLFPNHTGERVNAYVTMFTRR